MSEIRTVGLEGFPDVLTSLYNKFSENEFQRNLTKGHSFSQKEFCNLKDTPFALLMTLPLVYFCNEDIGSLAWLLSSIFFPCHLNSRLGWFNSFKYGRDRCLNETWEFTHTVDWLGWGIKFCIRKAWWLGSPFLRVSRASRGGRGCGEVRASLLVLTCGAGHFSLLAGDSVSESTQSVTHFLNCPCLDINWRLQYALSCRFFFFEAILCCCLEIKPFLALWGRYMFAWVLRGVRMWWWWVVVVSTPFIWQNP